MVRQISVTACLTAVDASVPEIACSFSGVTSLNACFRASTRRRCTEVEPTNGIFHKGKDLLDRVELGRVRRQKNDLCPSFFDDLTDLGL